MLEWFTTIPGILIICGVILLVIAIILFVVGAKKSKKEEVAVSDSTNLDSGVVDNNVTVENASSVSDVVPPVSTQDMNVPEVEVSPINMEIPNTIEEPIHMNEPEVVSIPEPQFANNNSEVSTPVVDDSTSDEVRNNDLEATTTIYGGEVPKFDFPTHEEKPVTIYGGNDPLEATQALPKMETTHIPYGGNTNEVRIVEPEVAPEIPTPIEETITPMPTPIDTYEQAPVDTSVEEPVINIPQEIPTVEASEEKVEEL